MAASTWHYLLQRLNGDGTGTFLDTDLPLTDVEITHTLSGPDRISGNIPIEIAHLKDSDGRPLFDPWSTAIYAESDGEIRAGGIVTNPTETGPSLQLDCAGFSAYPEGMPYTDSHFWVEVDPMDMAREIWNHLQSQPNGNLGLVLDDTTSPIRIGTTLTQVEFDTQSGPVSFEAGPYKLTWYQTFNLGEEFGKLAESTPFDYREEHAWNEAGTEIVHRLRLGYPRLGSRRPELTFIYGENVFVTPTVTLDGDSYANGVLVLGAGEGRDMVRSNVISKSDGRLRRVTVLTDKSLRSIASVNARARTELAWRQLLAGDTTEISVRDHPHAPLGSWQVGDEIYVQASPGWSSVGAWFRILSHTLRPDSPDVATLSLVRTDRMVT